MTNTYLAGPDVWPIDDSGKVLVCQKSQFVPGGANRQCNRPPNHPAPCHFPKDPIQARAALAAADKARHEADARAERLRGALLNLVGHVVARHGGVQGDDAEAASTEFGAEHERIVRAALDELRRAGGAEVRP